MLRPSETTIVSEEEYPPYFLCLSVMSSLGQMDNTTIEEILKDTTTYLIRNGITRKTVYVSHEISDYTISLFKVMGYRVKITARINKTGLGKKDKELKDYIRALLQ
jgi:hypothetical protein